MIRNLIYRLSINRFSQFNPSIQSNFLRSPYLKESAFKICSQCFSHLKSSNEYDHRILERKQSSINLNNSNNSRANYCLLSENEYGKVAEETLESLSDYLDELLEKQNKLTNYDLSLSVSSSNKIKI